MKKIITVFLIGISFLGKAQEVATTSIFDRKHEVKIGAVKLLSGGIVEATYEYVSSKDFSYGTSVLYNVDSVEDWPEDFSITPFARFYFQESREYGAKGFFVEGFGKFYTGKKMINDVSGTSGDEIEKKFSTGSLGLSLGKKWINSSGFVFEILCGVGRNFGGNDYVPDAVFRGDLNIGYRF